VSVLPCFATPLGAEPCACVDYSDFLCNASRVISLCVSDLPYDTALALSSVLYMIIAVEKF
jgi:hypothetical protein